MKKLTTQILAMLFITVTIFSSCDKEQDQVIPPEKNTIELASPGLAVPTEPLTLEGRILEFPTKQIATIRYYYIVGSDQYTERVSVESAFNRTSARYFNNALSITADGQKSDKNYLIPYNQYTINLNVPLTEYSYVGIEVVSTDGTVLTKAISL